ncbi:uncharacterized protein DUF4245 [Haloactinopolyspora alba]|uniref:Uncharacterized protein DUF4245 n=1 Tax=Haloactinopolyspora alba TaxID=648780 RepID=A0A2P8DX25_9ACTN|nr:DUF4245 domain-containing protein [Haloactinopolyspora alba]PSL01775.1 uncharacterized protein DUF4245 [Haloactinopolyspora alba]
MARSSRGNPSLGDILRSVLVLGGALAVVAVVFNLLNESEPRLPEPVDYSAALEVARAEYGYPVLAPGDLPQGWRATSVDFAQEAGGDRWRLGFLTEDEQYVGLRQSDGEIEAYRDEHLDGFTADGESTVDGTRWTRMIEDGNAPDRALVRVHDGAITIVMGTMSYASLEQFTARLR